MTISKSIVENHNGYIDFEDNTPEGTIFYVLLPTIDESIQEHVQVVQEIEYSDEKPSIFIYDDNDVISCVKRFLTDCDEPYLKAFADIIISKIDKILEILRET